MYIYIYMIKPILPFYTIFLVLLLTTYELEAQKLIVERTIFIGGDSCIVKIEDALKISNGEIIFVGESNCSNTGNIQSSNKGDKDLIVGKLDQNFNLLWTKGYGGSWYERAIQIVKIGSSNQFAILSYSKSSDGDISNFLGSSDCWLMVIDNQGTLKWSKNFGSSGDDPPVSIAATNDNGILLLGTTNGDDNDITSKYSSSPFYYDWFLLKVDSLGNKEWSKTIGGTKDEYGVGKIIKALNVFYLIGTSTSTDYDCLDTTWKHNNTKADILLIQTDSLGTPKWSRRYGGSEPDIANDAIWDNRDSSIVIVGYTTSKDIDITSYYGQDDVIVMKVDKYGKLIWSKTIGAGNIETDPKIIKVGDDYGIYMNTSSFSALRAETWLFILDKDGITINNILVGGADRDYTGGLLSVPPKILLYGYNYSDKFSQGLGSHNYSYSAPGYFSLIDYFPVSIDATIQNRNRKISLAPNPASRSVKVSLPRHNDQSALMVIDMMGRKVYAQKISANTNTIDLNVERIVSGDYTLVLKTNEGNYYQKLVVDH